MILCSNAHSLSAPALTLALCFVARAYLLQCSLTLYSNCRSSVLCFGARSLALCSGPCSRVLCYGVRWLSTPTLAHSVARAL
ncbi:Phytocyanin domain-containing protein [Psidium guajava]|nr:Phytocyanin domain-containing protein [Psidium guajava]